MLNNIYIHNITTLFVILCWIVAITSQDTILSIPVDYMYGGNIQILIKTNCQLNMYFKQRFNF